MFLFSTRHVNVEGNKRGREASIDLPRQDNSSFGINESILSFILGFHDQKNTIVLLQYIITVLYCTAPLFYSSRCRCITKMELIVFNETRLFELINRAIILIKTIMVNGMVSSVV